MALGGLVLTISSVGCGSRQTPLQQSAADATRLEQVVSNLRSGALIQKMNRDRSAQGAAVQASLVQNGGLHPTPLLARPDPCPEVSKLPAQAVEELWKKELGKLGACLRRTMEPVDLARGALICEITFRRSVTERALSRMSEDELTQLLRATYREPGALAGLDDQSEPMRLKLRNRFEDRELDELLRLAHQLNDKLSEAEASFFAAVDAHRALVEYFARISNRYELLLLLRDHGAKGGSARELGEAVSSLLKKSMKNFCKDGQLITRETFDVPKDLASFPSDMLHPWGIVAVSPDEGKEANPLYETLENPFHVILRALAQFGGSDQLTSAQRANYVALRDADNPPMPQHPAPDPKAVRVAIVDTGIDFLTDKDLGEYLSAGQPGAVSGSYDFEDDDSNPYLPAIGEYAHGSGTAAAFLTTLAFGAPEVLKARKLDLSMWKIRTIRDSLADPYMGLMSWQSRQAIAEALIREATDPRIKDKPKIVSISAIFALQPFLVNSHHTDAVLKAPWLWVMAAGNEGTKTEHDTTPVCLDDVPAQNRVDDRILCVGALHHATLEFKIAGYSNFGNRVDLYADEHAIDTCPNGTSCATPAISGAAAAVAAKYPDLSPEEIKKILVSAAVEQTLEVDTSTAPEVLTLPIEPDMKCQMTAEGDPTSELTHPDSDGEGSRSRHDDAQGI